MTNAPADLLSFRSKVFTLTGITDASAVGIVGDSAHAASGGYHEGKADLVNAGVFSSDYSVRLTRDRNACTESASAMDIGYAWPRGGNAAWLRFNNTLVAELHAGNPLLAPIRAVNYSPNGSTKLRTDRESGWSVVSSSDSVNIHTHIEWYRDTEGNRANCLGQLAKLIDDAVKNINPEDEVALTDEEHARLVNVDESVNKLISMNSPAHLTVGDQANNLAAAVNQILTKVNSLSVAGIDTVALGNQIAAAVISHHDALTDADQPAIEAAVRSVLHDA